MVWSIDRVGRSLVELVGFLDACRARGVEVYFHEQKFNTATANGMSLFDFAGMMALHLRQSRRDRILRGQAAARSMSIKFGRPPVPAAKAEKAKRALASGKGIRETARMVGISPASISRIRAAMNSEVVAV
jgi:DNA invertase Pin-like site-specific DNA recombinase